MRNFINKILCVLLNHNYRNGKCKCDKFTKRCVVTETCKRCGEENTFAFRKD